MDVIAAPLVGVAQAQKSSNTSPSCCAVVRFLDLLARFTPLIDSILPSFPNLNESMKVLEDPEQEEANKSWHH